jgi:hypothetical protein
MRTDRNVELIEALLAVAALVAVDTKVSCIDLFWLHLWVHAAAAA